jgi:hypothetical protein
MHEPFWPPAIAKLFVSDCFVKSSLDAVQIPGGYGYMTEQEVERDLRDSVHHLPRNLGDSTQHHRCQPRSLTSAGDVSILNMSVTP